MNTDSDPVSAIFTISIVVLVSLLNKNETAIPHPPAGCDQHTVMGTPIFIDLGSNDSLAKSSTFPNLGA